MSRSVRVILAASLALNLLLGGMVIGDVSHCLITPPAFNVSTQLSKLSPEKRALFENILEPAQQQMNADRTKIDDAKKVAVSLLKTEPFNEAAYRAQLDVIEDVHKQMKQKLSDAVVNLATKLNPEERGILADIISHPPFAMPPLPPQDKHKHTAQ